MKNKIIILVGIGLAAAAYFVPISWFQEKIELTFGAPSTALIYQKTILPISNSTYDLGTTTQNWRNVYFDKVCLSGDTCRTTWPGAGLTIGTVSTSTTPVVGNLAYWTSTAYPSLLGTVATTTLTGTAPLVFSNPISVIGGSASVLTCTAASGSVAGCLSSTDWTTFNNKGSGTITSIATTWPITGGTITTTGTLAFGGLSTSTAAVIGNIPYFSGVNTFANVATTSLTASLPLSLSQPISVIGSSASALTISVAGDWTGTIDGNNFAGGAIGAGELIYGGSAGSFSELALGTNGYALALSGGIPAWVATTTFSGGLTYSGGNVTADLGTSVDISAETNLAATAPIVLTNDTLSLGNITMYPAFTYSTSTSWVGTTTIPLGVAQIAETWNSVSCFTDTGVVWLAFDDGTNIMDYLQASTTVGIFTLSQNNSFSALEKRYVKIGNPASSPTRLSCTVNKTISAN